MPSAFFILHELTSGTPAGPATTWCFRELGLSPFTASQGASNLPLRKAGLRHPGWALSLIQ
jgi:hypothetical protein